MPERVNLVDEACIIDAKDGKFLCRLVHVAEIEKHTMGRKNVGFTEQDRDNLLNRSLENLKRQNIVTDFYFERWPARKISYDPDSAFIQKPIIHLTIEFYEKLSPVKVEYSRIGQY